MRRSFFGKTHKCSAQQLTGFALSIAPLHIQIDGLPVAGARQALRAVALGEAVDECPVEGDDIILIEQPVRWSTFLRIKISTGRVVRSWTLKRGLLLCNLSPLAAERRKMATKQPTFQSAVPAPTRRQTSFLEARQRPSTLPLLSTIFCDQYAI